MKKLMFLITAGILVVSVMGCARGSQAFNRGQRYAERGDLDLAIKQFEEALARDPKNIEYRSTLLRAQAEASDEHYRKAHQYLKEHKLDHAIVELQQALFLNPASTRIESTLKTVLNRKQAEEHYRAALTFAEMDRSTDAVAELTRAVELDPENAKYRNLLDQLQRKKAEEEPETPLTLTSDKPITLQFKDTNIKEVFEFLSRLSGVNIIFDEDVPSKRVTVFARDVSFQQALDIILSSHKLFMKQLNAQTIMIIPRTKAKTEEYDDLIVRTFYLSTARARDIVNLLRSMLDTKKVYVNEAVNSVSVRDTPEKIKLVEKIIAANDLKEAEVIFDIEILEILRTKTLKYGWNFSPSLSATAQLRSKTTGTSTTSGISLAELSSLSKENVILTLPGLVVNLIKQDSDAQTLANPRMRILNGKQGSFHIGDKIPIQTSTVTATTANTVTSSFEYKDIGIKTMVEPTVHLNGTVSLKLNLEISTLGEPVEFGGGQIQYRFGTRNTNTFVNLRDGETVIIGGLIRDEDRKGRIKVPLLGDVPVLGRLFSSSSDDAIKTDILMSITPTIVQPVVIPDRGVQTFWSGTEHIYDTKPLFLTGDTVSARTAAKKAPATAVDKKAVLDSLALRQTPAPPAAALPAPAGAAPAPAATATLALTPSEAAAEVGQEVRFELSAGSVQDLYGAVVTLGYDPAVLEFKTASEGPLLKQDGKLVSFMFSDNMRTGTVDIYMTRIGNVGGVEGTGALCSVVFRAKAGGSSDVTVKSVRMANAKRQELGVETGSARANVK